MMPPAFREDAFQPRGQVTFRNPVRRDELTIPDPNAQEAITMDHSNHVPLRSAELVPTVLEGATIYGPDDEKIGSVSHMHGSEVVVDVGGFLGIGAKPVAVSVSDLDFMRDEDGDVHAVTNWTKDQLKAMPEHHH